MLQLCRSSSQPIGGNYTVISQFLRKNMCERVWASFRAEEGGLRGTCSRRKTKGRGGKRRPEKPKKETERHVRSLLV